MKALKKKSKALLGASLERVRRVTNETISKWSIILCVYCMCSRAAYTHMAVFVRMCDHTHRKRDQY